MDPSRSLPLIPVAAGTPVSLPQSFERLYDLAYNMWWAWTPEARELWQRVSPIDWARSLNPLTVLQIVSAEQWEALEDNDSLVGLYERVIGAFDSYMSEEDTWYRRHHAEALPGGLAYLCTEYGVHHTLPFYSGGLGVLAGDHTKAASDLGIPMIGVGLLYRRGYFRQAVDPDGYQQHHYRPVEVARRPLRRVLGRSGLPLVIPVELPGRTVDVGAWRIDVGRVPLLLLDTDLASNNAADRVITHILYVRGREMRLCQEIVLGFGAVHLLEAIGMEPSTWHINEGHAAFSLLQRLSRFLQAGRSYDDAVAEVKRRSVFTLHTPLPAGNEAFDIGLVMKYLGGRVPGLSDQQLADLGGNSNPDHFDMGALAIRLSTSTNGVSRRHGEIVTGDWQHIIGGPAQAVTNGVHLPTWVGGAMSRHIASACGPEWARRSPNDPEAWAQIRQLPPYLIWEAHVSQKERLLRTIRRRLRDQLARHGAGPDELRRVGDLLPLDRLTIAFARRFTAYKRAGLLLTDWHRLRAILTNPERPVQLIFSGKAHPADREGQDLIRQVWGMAKSPELEGHVFFVEDYSMELSRYLVGGADVWLNTPRPPMEASGTSGMKAAANGVLNLSVLDGWWPEAYNGANGWALGDPHESDWADAQALYHLIESEVAPLYYNRSNGVPLQWVEMMQEAMASIGPSFSAARMVAEYVERLYLHANGSD
jgi:starch phosphorylase